MSYQYFKLTLKGEEPHYPIMPCDRFEYIFRTTTTDKSAAEAEIHSTAKMLVEEVVSITPVKPKKSGDNPVEQYRCFFGEPVFYRKNGYLLGYHFGTKFKIKLVEADNSLRTDIVGSHFFNVCRYGHAQKGKYILYHTETDKYSKDYLCYEIGSELLLQQIKGRAIDAMADVNADIATQMIKDCTGLPFEYLGLYGKSGSTTSRKWVAFFDDVISIRIELELIRNDFLDRIMTALLPYWAVRITRNDKKITVKITYKAI